MRTETFGQDKLNKWGISRLNEWKTLLAFNIGWTEVDKSRSSPAAGFRAITREPIGCEIDATQIKVPTLEFLHQTPAANTFVSIFFHWDNSRPL